MSKDFWEDDAVDIPSQKSDDFWGADAVAFPMKPLPVDKGLDDAIMRGIAQGSTMGFADELTAGAGALKDVAAAKLGLRGDISLGDAYDSYLPHIRGADDKAKDQHPVAYGASELGGSVAASIVAPGLGPVKGGSILTRAGKAALQGGLSGAGNSRASMTEDPLAFLSDVGKGAGVGALTQGVFDVAGKVAKPVASKVGQAGSDLLDAAGSNLKTSGAKTAARAAGLEADEAVGRKLLDDGVVRFGSNAESIGQRAAAKAEALSGEMEDIVRDRSMSAVNGSQVSNPGSLLDELAQKRDVMSSAAEAGRSTGAPSLVQELTERAAGKMGKSAAKLALGPKAWLAEKAFGVVKDRGGSAAAVTLDKIGDMVKSQPERFGRYARQLLDAASRGNHALAVTHFILSSQDEGYREQLESQSDDDL